MIDLDYAIEKVEAVPFAATPQLVFKLRVSQPESSDPIAVQNVLLACQIRIEPGLRRYSEQEQDSLEDLFGPPHQWSQTLRPMLWTHVNTVVPPFAGSTLADLHVPCTFDFNVAATKYFAGLDAGEVPIRLLFNGTIFYTAPGGTVQIAQIPWSKEVAYRLPVQVWQHMVDLYYPKTVWLCLRRDVFAALSQYKRDRGLATIDQVLESLLDHQLDSTRDASPHRCIPAGRT